MLYWIKLKYLFLQLQNSSVVTVSFRVQLASVRPAWSENEADTVTGNKTKLNINQFLWTSHAKTIAPLPPEMGLFRILVPCENFLFLCPTGAQNYSGLGVFSVVPLEGSILPKQSVELKISFQPDHPSLNYRDRLSVKLVNQVSVTHRDVASAV